MATACVAFPLGAVENAVQGIEELGLLEGSG
jgi:hypothetical protein